MIKLIKTEDGCFNENGICNVCKYDANALRDFRHGDEYIFSDEDFERLLPQINAFIGSCVNGCWGYEPMGEAIKNDRSGIFQEDLFVSS